MITNAGSLLKMSLFDWGKRLHEQPKICMCAFLMSLLNRALDKREYLVIKRDDFC